MDDWIVEALREAKDVARHQVNMVRVLLPGVANSGQEWLDKYGERVEGLAVSTTSGAQTEEK